jgi:hypothetical protein
MQSVTEIYLVLMQVKDAALSVVRQVKPNMRAASKAPAKGFAAKAASITSAFHIDIPIASNDADSLVKLAATLVSALSSASFKAASDTLVVFASSDAAAKAAGTEGHTLTDSSRGTPSCPDCQVTLPIVRAPPLTSSGPGTGEVNILAGGCGDWLMLFVKHV